MAAKNRVTCTGLVLLCVLAQALPASAQSQKPPPLFIGMHWVNPQVGWVSGTQSSLWRTQDAGESWQRFTLPQNDSLQFRDVHAFNEDSCLVMAAGEGKQSRIYSFAANRGFELRFTVLNPQGFLDGLALLANGQGYAYGDAIDEFPYLLATTNFGRTWQRVNNQKLPTAPKGEGGFAASGTGVFANSKGLFLVGTGAAHNARLLVKNPQAENWESAATPMPKGDFAGITSVQVLDSLWTITGGNLADTNQQQNIFLSLNQGQSWQAVPPPPLKGAFYGSALGCWNNQTVLAVTGPQGAALTFNLGQTWRVLTQDEFWTCALVPQAGKLWAAGRNGKIEAFDLNSF